MSQFYNGLAEVFEIDAERVTSAMSLSDVTWDSLAIVSTIALVDDCFNVVLDGQSLAKCSSIADIEKLIEASRRS